MEITRRDGMKLALGSAAWAALGPGRAWAKESMVTLRAAMNMTERFDPHMLASYPTRNASYMVFDTLFSVDSKGRYRPQMVEKYEISDNHTKFTFKLRPHLFWHDGKPVRAADCVASIRRWARHDGIGQMLMANLASLKTDSDDTFTLRLKAPSGIVLQAFGKSSSVVPFMMPERDAMKEDLGADYRPLGSGPFIFNRELYRPGNKIVFDKNPHYVPRKEPADFLSGGKVVHVDRVEWVGLPNANSITEALQSGEIDYAEWVDFDSVDTLFANKHVHIVNVDPVGKQGYLRMNQAIAPFKDERMRRAMLYATDQKAYVEAITGNHSQFYTVCGAYFFCGMPLATEIGAVKFDLAKAKVLIKEAGYNGEPIGVFEATDVITNKIGSLVMAQQAQQAGFNVKSIPMGLGNLLQARTHKTGWSLQWGYIEGFDGGSPLSNPYLRANCDEAMPGWPCDSKLEDLRAAYATTVDPNKRMEIVRQLQLRAYQVLPYIPTGQYRIPSAVRSNVTDVLISGLPVFWHLKKHVA
jgi:peptide/nickel transport system substrate-binding protein